MKCNICSSHGSLLWRIKGFNIYKCKDKRCELIYTDVVQNNLDNIYEVDYYKEVYPDYESEREIYQRNNDILLNEIGKYFEVCSLLEIGSAFGFFLESSKSKGWETIGFETSKYASEIGNRKYKCNIKNSDFLLENITGYYDVACMLDTIEHVLDPSKFIKKIATILRPGGGIVITTGDINSIFARLFGRKWRLIHPPFHIYYFSPKSLSFLLQKYGFSVISISHPGKYFDVRSILQYSFGIDKKKVPSLPIRLNVGDIMTVVAKKRND